MKNKKLKVNNLNNQELITYGQHLQENVNKLLVILNNLLNVSSQEYTNKELNQILSSIHEETKKGIEKLSVDLRYFEKNVEWNSFNVAFFGETNAGKSTLLEALIRGDGRSIGEGYKDHTKRIYRHSFDNLNLMDMPGIEGIERRFVDEIRKAVDKAHVIIYVLEPKEPEEGTLRKIKGYLKDKVKVISVINVRGKPGIYSFKEKVLVDKNIKIVEQNSIKKFKDVLGENYYKNIILNAYIGFLSIGKPKRDDFIKDKNKAIEIFGSLQEAYNFSNLEELNRTIEHLSHSSNYDIAISNTYKVLSNTEKILNGILKEKKKYDSVINNTISELYKTFENAKNLLEKYKKEIKQYLESQLEELRIKLNKIVSEGIEKSQDEGELKNQIHNIIKESSGKTNRVIEYKINELERELNVLFDELNKHIALFSRFIDLRGEINLRVVIEKIKIGMDYILKQVLDVGLSIYGVVIAFIINPILGVITAIVSIVRKIWDWFFGDPAKRKREAMKKAYDEIEKTINNIKYEVNSILDRNFRDFDFNLKEVERILKGYIDSIKSIRKSMNELISDIKSIKAELSLLLVRYITERDIELAYIDLNLSKMLVVGDFHDIDHNMFRIKDILSFKSLEELYNHANVYHDFLNNTLFVKDEFIYRALSSNQRKLGIDKIKKEGDNENE